MDSTASSTDQQPYRAPPNFPSTVEEALRFKAESAIGEIDLTTIGQMIFPPPKPWREKARDRLYATIAADLVGVGRLMTAAIRAAQEDASDG